jgi:ATP-dependent Lhr-like helicase
MARAPNWRRWCARAAASGRLPDTALTAVLDMLAGLYPSHDISELRPAAFSCMRIENATSSVDGAGPHAGRRQRGPPSRTVACSRYTCGADGPRVGELDEEMVHESQAGQRITLGATTWRIQEITPRPR